MPRSARVRNGAAALALTMTIAGCAAPRPSGSVPSGSGVGGGEESACNEFVVGAIAAAICGAVASGNQRLRTAAVCAAAAAFGCYVFNSYQTNQTRSAREVSDEYVKAKGALPDAPMVKTYTTTLTPQTAVRKGGKLTMASDIEVIPGRNSSAVRIDEELVIRDSVGDIWAGPRKKQANERSNAAGRYTTLFDLPIRNDMQQGRYTYEKTLYLDGQAVAARRVTGAFDVVLVDGAVQFALAQ